jgi:hypothetical protein
VSIDRDRALARRAGLARIRARAARLARMRRRIVLAATAIFATCWAAAFGSFAGGSQGSAETTGDGTSVSASARSSEPTPVPAPYLDAEEGYATPPAPTPVQPAPSTIPMTTSQS